MNEPTVTVEDMVDRGMSNMIRETLRLAHLAAAGTISRDEFRAANNAMITERLEALYAAYGQRGTDRYVVRMEAFLARIDADDALPAT